MQKFGIRTSVVAGTLILAMILSIMPIAMATGNGAPSGAHYNVNIIGVQNGNTVNTSGSGTLVDLYGSDNVSIANTLANSSTPVTYEIYVRALGKPGGSANLTTGLVDSAGNYWYSLNNVTFTRTSGKAVFDNDTMQFGTVYADLTNDGIDNPQVYNVFSNATYNYFWNIDNNGLKLLQIRVYAVQGTTPTPTPTATPTPTPTPTATPTPAPEPSPEPTPIPV